MVMSVCFSFQFHVFSRVLESLSFREITVLHSTRIIIGVRTPVTVICKLFGEMVQGGSREERLIGKKEIG